MATVTAFETHRHFLGVVRLDLELPDCIAGILEELHLCEGCARARRCSAVVWDNSALARSSSTRPRFCSRFARSPSAISLQVQLRRDVARKKYRTGRPTRRHVSGSHDDDRWPGACRSG